MRQVWIPKIGGPEVMELRETADPEPGKGEIRIRVRATGVNFADIMARMGLYPDAPKLPTVVGYEVAGEITALGEGATRFKVGDRVVSMTRFGGYSNMVCVPEVQAATLPDNIDFAEGASIPVNFLTAWLMLVRLGNLQKGERVLVHAVAGGVGQAAVQICKLKGAEVIGTASAPKHARLKAMGVEHCIDYRNQDFEAEVMRITKNEGVAIALDAVAGTSFKKSYRCLSHLGRLYMFGASSMATGKKRSIVAALSGLMKMPKFKAIPMMDANRGVHGVNLGHLWHMTETMAGMLQEIVDLIAAGEMSTVLDRTFPLEDASVAHEYIQDRKNFGKIVLTC